jgi:hypothetical protein
MSEWTPPNNHPIDEARAREIVRLIGQPSREFIASCCVPLFWFAAAEVARTVLSNGTVTLVKTPTRTIGLTADHVVAGCLKAFDPGGVVVQIGDISLHDLRSRLIARSDELDLASFEVGDLIGRFGAGWPRKLPLVSWPPSPPQEGRGIMIGGYPGIERRPIDTHNISFGIFTALGIARTVSDDQISCLFEREYLVETSDFPSLPPNIDLGGISGGPVITVMESTSYLVSYRLGGIVSEASAELAKVFAKRVDFIKDDGSF